MAKEKIIEIKDVSFTYKGESGVKKAISNLSLDINKGEFLAIIGHNGSGKSTLAKLMNGLLHPDTGTVSVSGNLTTDKNKTFEVRKTAGIVFQNPDNQMVASIVEDDIAFGPENLGVPREEIIRRVDWALKVVGMEEYKKATPFKMSGGQKQRIAIAAILAMKPEVLILDESTAMLDPTGRQDIHNVILKLKEEGISVVLITHYMDEALRADRIVVMDHGVIVKNDVPQEVFKDIDTLKKANLKLPLIVDITHQLKSSGIELPDNIYTVEELGDALCQLL